MTIVNGIVASSELFEASGPWCFDGGGTSIKTVQMELEEGINFVEFRPTGTEAPIIDKIVIKEVAQGGEALAVVKVSASARASGDEPSVSPNAFAEAGESQVYPNPVRVGEHLTIRMFGLDMNGIPIKVGMTDMSGKTMFTDEVDADTQSIPLKMELNKGFYIFSIQIGDRTYYRRIEVD